jgi:DHA2 family lincomycin resistance protein-like MFS transporter
VLSLGLALSFTPLFTASLGSLPKRLYSHGSAVVGTVQQVAGAAGIAAMIAVMSAVSISDGAVDEALTAGGSHGAFLIRKPADDIEDAAV